MDYDTNELLKKTSVLLVEDEEEIRQQLASFLKRRVGALYTAANGNEGLELFTEYRPDIIITDIRMPVMDGLEMAKEIKKIDPGTPIAIITAYNDQNYFMKSIEISIDRYVLKPVETEKILKTITDIAESLYRKKEIERMKKELDDSLRLQSVAQLTKGLSHNFNNILVGIMGYAGLARMKLSLIEHKEIPEVLNYLDTIEKSANRASELIRLLMTFSSKIECEKTEFNITDAVSHVLEIIRLSFPENIKIETHLQDDLPVIYADKSKLQQAMLNICINAKEAMQNGGVLKIETFNEQDSVALRISDTGCGMDEDTKRRIFEPFFTTKGLVSHMGLGLSITSSIIRQHNGFIKVDSEIGKGSAFTIYLPVLKEKEQI
jgi:signal transduction histidine kinase